MSGYCTVLAVSGRSLAFSGRLPNAKLVPCNTVVSTGKIAEWRVYCDNEPIREKMRAPLELPNPQIVVSGQLPVSLADFVFPGSINDQIGRSRL